ncbi:hypothetical protein GLOIN_2v1784235 [Rhizophagus irregularis DAOM 181602=DAOM 197198]|uniref:SHSP domain-containing protein n=1 Tax=Rhizophagus irregularis (strain DAOM 181602 / DAOM 197198 / MUCL 43194) TaxID=747089 RepID=A0A2P4PD30_RHIID|nr:hypothetical protein GLOIN_2v1784235 [Rhizophagus irregularis DAOM 181602=DAOM 197198]POG63294.1 hypothetical protein GLOIN_2v1784235 [Rhizophagus irregularis DAOM 181602=DAOM 197198]|eukprot:XP_025170160.1 hypothetical protein GLOIN_2v1784235 [Rhizophagus irregularis DAOM 181602=DAOM 197198]
MEFGGGFTFDKEPCHPDNCSLFIGGDNLAGMTSLTIENWIKKNETIPQNFAHIFKKRKENYGFIHFVDEETKINFFEEVDGKKFKIGQESEEELTIHFFPLVRKKQAEHKTVDSNYGPSHNLYNLYDDGTIFSLYINIPTINNKDEISLYVDDDDKVVIISGEYKNINIVEGNHFIKKLIPTGRFETKIPLPSRIDPTKKVKIEKVDAISLFKITFTKGEGYKKRRLSIE